MLSLNEIIHHTIAIEYENWHIKNLNYRCKESKMKCFNLLIHSEDQRDAKSVHGVNKMGIESNNWPLSKSSQG